MLNAVSRVYDIRSWFTALCMLER